MREIESLLSKLPRVGEVDPERVINELGERLRALTFVGEGFGCYSNFDVRPDARQWDYEERLVFSKANNQCSEEYQVIGAEEGSGYSFQFADIKIEVFWHWDGDGVLIYRVTEGAGQIVIENGDCKKDYTWKLQTSTLSEKPLSREAIKSFVDSEIQVRGDDFGDPLSDWEDR